MYNYASCFFTLVSLALPSLALPSLALAGFFAVFFLLALLLDRRALLISTQLYIIYAFTQLLQQQLSGGQNILMLIMMALGLFIIFFGSYWYWVRRRIFGFLRATAISRYIPDLNQQDGQRKQRP